jgi:predicted NBD/HSP70 family sugar kinase
VSTITATLGRDGVIKSAGSVRESDFGRRTELLTRNPNAYYSAAVHITPERCVAGLYDFAYRQLATREFTFPVSFTENDAADIAEALEEMIGEHGASKKVVGLGLALPNHPFDKEDVRQRFEQRLDLPVFVVNNVETMALCHYYFDLHREFRTIAFAYVGTGIGSGLIIDGSLYTGESGNASDLGHIYITDRDTQCRCGRVGCLETVAAEWSIARRLAEIDGRHDAPSRWLLIDELSTRLSQNDAQVLELIDEVARYLGRAFFNLRTILDPEAIFFTGRLNALGPYVRNLIEREYVANAQADPRPIAPLRFLDFREDAGLTGAAIHAFVSVFCESRGAREKSAPRGK